MKLNLFDIENAAKQKLSTMAYEYYAHGACDQVSIQQNRHSYDQINLIPKVLVDVSNIDLSCSILQEKLTQPFLISPSAYHGMAHVDGEVATAKAALKTRTLMTVSTMANATLEEVAAVGSQCWFQLYIFNDRDFTLELVKRAERSGYTAIVLTLDSQVLGIRHADFKNQFKLPAHLSVPNLKGLNTNVTITAGEQSLFAKHITWQDIDWLKRHTDLPIILKGILHPEDAKKAVSYGVDGIVVSNHGGRQLDTAIPPIVILPKIKQAVKDNCSLLLDSGIRRGTDIVKAIALGADAVLIGRPIIWGLAMNGAEGVAEVIQILQHELKTAMGLCGLPSVQAIKDAGKEILYAPHLL